MALVLVSAIFQGVPDVSASVDRTRVRVGEEVVVTVRVRTAAREAVRIEIPPPAGFVLVGSREITDVAVSGGGRLRTTVRELRLRADQAGRVELSGIRVRQGDHIVMVDPIPLDVAAAPGGTAGLSDAVRALIDAAPSPRSADTVAVFLLASADHVYAAEQLDIVAVAWFPRELRLRLRRAPILGFRTPDAVWAYPLLASGDVAASRRVRGRWFDLFVAHQVVFPLQPGRVTVSPARVDFALPVSYSFFSREDRYTLRSDSLNVSVLPLPPLGRPNGDRGVAARGLRLARSVATSEARVGEPLEIAMTIAGGGNVALWPEPVMQWPAALRAYPGETAVALDAPGGPVGGRKTFRYLIVPDSAGVLVLPEVRYPYYDLTVREYRVARVPAQAVAVAPGGEAQPTRPVPPLAGSSGAPAAARLARRLPRSGWLALLIMPPVLVWLVRRPPQRRARRQVAAPVGLAALERQFQAVLASHVPDSGVRAGGGLAQALRATGVEHAVAERVMRLRDRLRAARYGPRRADVEPQLAADIHKVLRVLDGEPIRRRRRRHVGAIALLAVALPSISAGQSAEALYEAGALRAAADSFAARAERSPDVVAHWYNLGATLYRAGADGKASVAWTRAARLAPRDPLVHRARQLLAPPDQASGPLLAVGLATPAEYALVAVALWLVLWAAVLLRRRMAVIVTLAALVAAAAVPALVAWRHWSQSAGVVLEPGATVRSAPYGSASAFGSLDAGAAVRLGTSYGAWVEVRREDGVHGWLLRSEIAPL